LALAGFTGNGGSHNALIVERNDGLIAVEAPGDDGQFQDPPKALPGRWVMRPVQHEIRAEKFHLA
jgi:hypothetical protein